MRLGVVVCMLATGCGRVGFGELPDAHTTVPIDGSARVSIQVASANDDAEEGNDGVMYLDSTDLELCDDFSSPHLDQIIGMRFVGIPAQRGAKVVHAKIQFTVEGPPLGAAGMLTLHGGLLPAAAFTAANFDLRVRLRTTSSVPWMPTLWTVSDEAGPAQRTPELAPIVDEILARPEWTAGSAIAIFVTGIGTNQARTFESAPSQAPTLELEYEP